MMLQQQQQQQQQRLQQGQQQRPNQNGVQNNNIQQLIYNTLNQNTGILSGWQSTVLIQERIGLICNMSVFLRSAIAIAPWLQCGIITDKSTESGIFDLLAQTNRMDLHYTR